LRDAAAKNCVAASCSGDGPLATSMTTSTPVSAAARPSPVTTSTPVARDIGTTSWPRALRISTTWEPTRPVAPATAIFISVCMMASPSDLVGLTALTDPGSGR
jgi:hypothetical protein